jgi:hypothetical protein
MDGVLASFAKTTTTEAAAVFAVFEGRGSRLSIP